MTPQSQTVLRHLMVRGSITPVEAATVYKVRHLPSKIFELKGLGFRINTHLKRDLTNQRYAHYEFMG